jgi:serine/threonine protein kinase
VLHERGLVHRDVKPENVMIDKNGRVVLIDFNASRKVSEACKDTVIMGTVGYASPEQLGVTQSDARTDIYATGILLNVMLTGKHPTEAFAKGRAGRIIRKCTALNPDDRYQCAEKLSDALHNFFI